MPMAMQKQNPTTAAVARPFPSPSSPGPALPSRLLPSMLPHRSRATAAPARPPHATPPPPSEAPPAAAAAFVSPGGGGSRAAKRGRFVEHLVPEGGVVSVPPAAARYCNCWDDVPPELLPFKKRIVRHHPYAAALAIQEMAMEAAAEAEPTPTRDSESDDDDCGLRLRAELLRLRISRPALVLTKPLTVSDRSCDKARLVLPDGLVAPSPLLGMLTPLERRLVLGAGLPVPALDRLGRAYRMTLRRDPSAGTYRLTGQWSLFVSRHDMAAGDAVEVRAFRPPAWQARLDKRGEGGLGMALLHLHGRHRPHGRAGNSGGWQQGRYHYHWCRRELDAADGLLRIAASAHHRATA